MKELELRLTDLLARKADEVDTRPVDGFAEAPYMTALASTDPSVPEAGDLTAIDLHPASAIPAANRNRHRVAALLAVAAAAVVVVAVLALRPSNHPEVITPADTAVTPSTELGVRSLDPPIECELELCPSLAVSPGGTLVAYDQAAKTLTWYDAEPTVVPVTAELDAAEVRLVAVGLDDVSYLLAGSPGTDGWELVAIDPSGDDDGRLAASSPNIEPSSDAIVERLCWSGCEPETRRLLPWISSQFPYTYPVLSRTARDVEVELGEQRWEIAWSNTLSTRSQVAPRWGGGAVASLVPEAAGAPSELIELLPDGSVQRFGLGDEAVHALLPDGSAVVWRDDQLVRLSPPQTAERPAAWSPELTAEVLESPFDCDRSSYCPNLAVSPDGTLVAYDSEADTLTWYEDEPRVVPLSVDLGYGTLIAIGPHDIAYILQLENFAAVAPSGEVIAEKAGRLNRPVSPAAAGLFVNTEGWPSPNGGPFMPWVDLDGNPITDTRPYPTAEPTDAGTVVRFGEREWLLPELSGSPDLRARSDGGVVVVGYTFPEQTSNLFELMPDGTIERYFVEFVSSMRPYTVLPDGSLIVEHDAKLVRLTPPG